MTNLLSSTSRVEVPFIKVTIGEYTFGVFNNSVKDKDANNVYRVQNIKFPNYIKSLNVRKINGTVNKYTLNIEYPITPTSDPNFFEKVFSSVKNTRKIIFSYGDLNTPTFLYKEEECIILDIKPQFSMDTSKINYTVTAQSGSVLLNTAAYSFPAVYEQPSVVIEQLLRDKDKGLLEIFYGMRNMNYIEELIPHDDAKVNLHFKRCTVIEYLNYLVSCMRPNGTYDDTLLLGSKYYIVIHDDFTSKYGGPYFSITRTDKDTDVLEAYELEIGYPTAQSVISFSIDSSDEYALFYEYNNKLDTSEYAHRIDDEGNLIEVYAPTISSNNNEFKTREEDKNWWTAMTEFPVKATITVKGLLRSAQLMSYIRLNIRFYGKKHVFSGLYIITQQEDNVSQSGFRTTLSLLRVKGDINY